MKRYYWEQELPVSNSIELLLIAYKKQAVKSRKCESEVNSVE